MARFFKRGGDGGDGQMNLFTALGGGEGVRLEEPEKIELGAESIRMVLPRRGVAGEGHTAPEVASEVRSAFSGEAKKTGAGGGDGGPAMVIPGEKVTVGRAGSVMEGKPLPPTGVFRRPEPPSPPPAEEAAAEPEAEKQPEGDGKGAVWEDEEEGIPLGMWARAWLAGVDWNGKTIGALAGAMVLVAALAVWSVRGCGAGGAGEPEVAAGNGAGEPTVVEDVGGTPNAGEAVAIAEMGGGGAAGTESAGAVGGEGKPETAATAGGAGAAAGSGPAMAAWSVPGTKVEVRGGSQFVVFEEAVFESKDAISVAGMRAIRALAAKLKTLEGGAAVVVTGYTDDQPLTRPTAQFASNEDIAMARAVAAADHLKAYAKNKGLSFECVAGRESEAPYPNDSPANRKKNRTVTVLVTPGG